MAKQKRILFLMSRFLDGGIDTVLIEYLNWLAQDDQLQITLAIAIYMDDLEVFRERIPKNVRVVYFAKAGWLTNLYHKRVIKKASSLQKTCDEMFLAPIRKLLTRINLWHISKNYDVVVDFDCCFYSSMNLVKVRKLAFFHFSFKHMAQQDPRRMNRIGKRLENYDKVILIAEGMRQEAMQMYPSLAQKFEVLYNPKDPNEIKQLSLEHVVDEHIKEPFILAIERLTEPKDIPTLLKAYALFRQQHPERSEHLYIIGKGEQESSLRNEAVRLRIASDVMFLGFMENPLPWLKASSLLVHSSRYEGLGVVMIEGLFLQKLIVATDCPIGPREVLANGEAGLLTPVGDAQALADAMYKALTDTELKQSLLSYGKKHVQKFTFDTIGHQLLTLMFPEA